MGQGRSQLSVVNLALCPAFANDGASVGKLYHRIAESTVRDCHLAKQGRQHRLRVGGLGKCHGLAIALQGTP